jgi:DNA-binding transcriptional MerR regulator
MMQLEMSLAKYHTVTDVCRRLGIKPHILRYWERVFELKPARNSAGRRIYSESQLERLQVIKHLVRSEGLTIQGARRQLARMPAQPKPATTDRDHRQTLLWLKRELVSVKALLDAHP